MKEGLKCVVESSGLVSRVTESEADRLVKSGKASYCPKSLWKKQKNPTKSKGK